MKTIAKISLCAVAAMAAVSCNKAELSEQLSSNPVRAEINAYSSVSSKLTIDGVQTSWEVGDKVSLFDTKGTYEGDFEASASGTNVVFTGEMFDDADILKVAVFPANEKASYFPSTNSISTVIPAEQNGKISTCLSVAENGGNNNFAFINAASVIKVTIPESEAGINFISFTADANAAIAGDVTINMNDGAPVAVPSEESGATSYSRIIVYNNGEPLVGDQYITVIPGSYSGTIVFGKTENSLRYASAKIIDTKTYSVNKIKNFGNAANLSWVEGAVTGVFTVNDKGTKVLMSQGFIRYNKSFNLWTIADSFKPITYTADANVVELFGWNNADDPANIDLPTEAWGVGDWSKKLPQEGWSILSSQELEYVFKTAASTADRQAAGIVKQAVGLAHIGNDAKKNQYVILYPDGWSGEFIPDNDVFATKVTEADLKALEDKGCAILAGGDNVTKTGGITKTNFMILWSSSGRKNSKGDYGAEVYRLYNNSGALVRDIKYLESNYGYRARASYEIK